jgi:hypothetical protein
LENLPPYDNVQEALEALLYVTPVISEFTAGSDQREKGQPVTGLTFTWTLNKTVTSQTLTGPPEMTPVGLSADQRTVTVSLTNLASTATFTLTVDDGTTEVSSDWILKFLNGNYYGDEGIPASINSAFILSLNKTLAETRALNYVTDAVGTEYNWYAVDSVYGSPVFKANGVIVTYTLADTIAFTNAYGHLETYNIYRSDFPDIGPGVNIEVT